MKLELINEFSKLPRVKINTQKSVVFLYTKYKHVDTKIYNAISFRDLPGSPVLRLSASTAGGTGWIPGQET